jgi:hypothetical protein
LIRCHRRITDRNSGQNRDGDYMAGLIGSDGNRRGSGGGVRGENRCGEGGGKLEDHVAFHGQF